MRKLAEIKRRLWLPRNDIDAPSRGILCNWVREGDGTANEIAPVFDMARYPELLALVPDKVAASLERARETRAGLREVLRAGGGSYEELLSSIIQDATAVGTSSAEAKLAPTLVFGKNYMQPGGLPGKTLRVVARGRETTLATAATMTFRLRIAATDIITGNIVAATDPITQDATGQTNSQWKLKADIVSRTVGSAGTVQGQGHADMAGAALTVAAQTAKYMGSAGALTPAAQTWDMNNDQYFQFTAQWSLATAYSIQTHQYIVEALN